MKLLIFRSIEDENQKIGYVTTELLTVTQAEEAGYKNLGAGRQLVSVMPLGGVKELRICY